MNREYYTEEDSLCCNCMSNKKFCGASIDGPEEWVCSNHITPKTEQIMINKIEETLYYCDKYKEDA